MVVKPLMTSLTILNRGSLKREIPKRIKNAETKKLTKSNTRIMNLSVLNYGTLGLER